MELNLKFLSDVSPCKFKKNCFKIFNEKNWKQIVLFFILFVANSLMNRTSKVLSTMEQF